MPTVSEAMAIGLAQQQAGRLREAELTCRQILAIDPTHAPAWHLLGVLAYQAGQYEIASEHIGRAVQLATHTVGAHNNLRLALPYQAKLDEAMACYRRALELKPDLAEVHNNIGNVCKDQGMVAEAVACFRRSLELDPASARTHSNLLGALPFCPG